MTHFPTPVQSRAPSQRAGTVYHSRPQQNIISLQDGTETYANEHPDDDDHETDKASAQQPPLILIVDDEASLRDMLARFLTRSGYRILTAGDGLEALEVCRQHADSIRLVLLDMTMPRMGGATCAALLRQDHTDISIIMMSAYTDPDTLERSRPLRDAYLSKPFQLSELRQLIEQFVRKQ